MLLLLTVLWLLVTCLYWSSTPASRGYYGRHHHLWRCSIHHTAHIPASTVSLKSCILLCWWQQEQVLFTYAGHCEWSFIFWSCYIFHLEFNSVIMNQHVFQSWLLLDSLVHSHCISRWLALPLLSTHCHQQRICGWSDKNNPLCTRTVCPLSAMC